MACASAQLAVEMRVNTPNEMVATPCAGELVVAAMGSHALDHLTQCRWGSVTALRMACALVQLAVEVRISTPNEMVATPCP